MLLPTPNPGFCTMPPRGGPLIPPPSPPRGPPGPRRQLSWRSPSRAARVFFSSTFRRTSPLNMMGCKNQGEQIYRGLMNYSQKSSKRAYEPALKDKRKLKKEKQNKEPAAYKSAIFSEFTFCLKLRTYNFSINRYMKKRLGIQVSSKVKKSTCAQQYK